MNARSVLGLALTVAVVLAPVPAAAVPNCGGVTDNCPCNASNPYPCCSNGGNCTWWAWHKACCVWDVGLPGWGNANTWAYYANLNSSYEVLSNPVVNSIGCRASGEWGHVVWVPQLPQATDWVAPGEHTPWPEQLP